MGPLPCLRTECAILLNMLNGSMAPPSLLSSVNPHSYLALSLCIGPLVLMVYSDFISQLMSWSTDCILLHWYTVVFRPIVHAMLHITYIVHLTCCSRHPKYEIKGPFQVLWALFSRFWIKNSPFQAPLWVTFATVVRFMTNHYQLHEQSVKTLQYCLLKWTIFWVIADRYTI